MERLSCGPEKSGHILEKDCKMTVAQAACGVMHPHHILPDSLEARLLKNEN